MPTPRAETPRLFTRNTSIAVLLAVGAFLGAPSGARAQVSATNSFYVPQSGTVASPSEGTLATRFFRACPNNDGNGSLSSNARIKIVLRDGGGLPISGVAAADICVLFNGGTAAQGFAGVGADSIIANSLYNPEPLCPNVTCLQADAPTDVNGVTYITFAGADPLVPGVTLRNPNRKWGHYDSHLPVFALGTQLLGRITSGSSNGTYELRIKNLDVVDGLELDLNAGAAVTIADFSSISWSIGESSPVSYWLDLDSDGIVGPTDFNLMSLHFNHDCDTPLSP